MVARLGNEFSSAYTVTRCSKTGYYVFNLTHFLSVLTSVQGECVGTQDSSETRLKLR